MDEDGKFILDMDNPHPLIYQQMTYVGNLPGIWGFKLGIEAFLHGADYIFNAYSPHRIFLDTKIWDTAYRVRSDIEKIAALNLIAPWFVSVGFGSAHMIASAVTAAGPKVHVIVVPVLSDLTEQDIKLEFGTTGIERQRKGLRFAVATGAAGVTCPSRLLPNLNNSQGKLVIATGVRDYNDERDGHVDPLPPEEAFGLGATHVVLGRSIHGAPNPMAKLESILKRCGF
jgi:orotidine-5'-phosphate decarboxylase